MESELPTADLAAIIGSQERRSPSDPVRKNRQLLVPDTVEWSGRRPLREPRRYEPIEVFTTGDYRFRMPCFEKKKNRRTIGVSSCTMLETPTMPFADHAWESLDVAESYADLLLRPGYRISRVDLARDVRVPESEEFLCAAIRALAGRRYLDTYSGRVRLGLTITDVEGVDRLRIYHKGLETRKKYGYPATPKQLMDVIRVEAQLRPGQLEDEHRESVRDLQSRRVRPGPDEHRPPEMRIKTRFGKGIRRRHLRAMNRDWQPQLAVATTGTVDSFLMSIGLEALLPDWSGTELVDPRYGETTPAMRQR